MKEKNKHLLPIIMEVPEMEKLDQFISEWAKTGAVLNRSSLVRVALDEYMEKYNIQDTKDFGNVFDVRVNPLEYGLIDLLNASKRLSAIYDQEQDETVKYFLIKAIELVESALTVERNISHFIYSFNIKKAKVFGNIYFKQTKQLFLNYFEKYQKRGK